jgi:hypothetical protein
MHCFPHPPSLVCAVLARPLSEGLLSKVTLNLPGSVEGELSRQRLLHGGVLEDVPSSVELQ